MCLAAVIPAGKNIKPEYVAAAWSGNDDGAGFAYHTKGKVKVEKGFMTLKELVAAFAAAKKKYDKATFLLHFRITSMGASTADNTHPFLFDNTALIHNGTLTGTDAKYGTGPSDTACLVKDFSEFLTLDSVTKNQSEIEKALGSGNKIALLYGGGEHVILNANLGTWEDGVWFSNHSFRPRNSSAYSGPSCAIGADTYQDEIDQLWGTPA